MEVGGKRGFPGWKSIQVPESFGMHSLDEIASCSGVSHPIPSPLGFGPHGFGSRPWETRPFPAKALSDEKKLPDPFPIGEVGEPLGHGKISFPTSRREAGGGTGPYKPSAHPGLGAAARRGQVGCGMDLVWSGICEGSHGRGSMGGFRNWCVENLLQGDAPVPGKWGALSRGKVRLNLMEFLQFSLADGFLCVPCSAWTTPAAQGRMPEPSFPLSSQHSPRHSH